MGWSQPGPHHQDDQMLSALEERKGLPGFVVLSSLLPTFSNQSHLDLVVSPLPEVTRKDPKSQRGGHFEGAAENVDGGATEVTLGGHQVPRAGVRF